MERIRELELKYDGLKLQYDELEQKRGAHAFCRIRSFISTLRKQERDVWQGLQAVCAGQVPQVLVTPANTISDNLCNKLSRKDGVETATNLP